MTQLCVGSVLKNCWNTEAQHHRKINGDKALNNFFTDSRFAGIEPFRSNAYIAGSGVDVGADIFRRGLCLPSDNKMTAEQQDVVIEIIHRCFK